MKLHLKLFEGIGDSLYVRPIIKRLVADGHSLWLETALPEAFADLDVKFVKCEPRFRTQSKSYAQTKVKLTSLPKVIDKVVQPFYRADEFLKEGVMGVFEHEFGYVPHSQPLVFDLPPLPPHGLALPSKPLAVIRPNTIRKEWQVPARNCHPKYLYDHATLLMTSGYHVVTIADTEPFAEWLEQPEPDAHVRLTQGELSIWQTLSLIKDAALVVGSPGFVLPAAVSAHVPLFLMFGGRGGYDCPELLLDKRMDLTKVVSCLPVEFCRCKQRMHDCNKVVREPREQLLTALKGWNLPPFPK